MEQTKKRIPIRKKLQQAVMLLALVSLFFTTAAGMINIFLIRRNVLAAGNTLGNTAAANSSEALLGQMKQNMLDVVTDRAKLADTRLENFAANVEMSSLYLTGLYQNPDQVLPREVYPPNIKNKDILVAQRTLADPGISYSDVSKEMSLLGNAASFFDPVIRKNPNITSIYAGTASGFMISYDTYSASGDLDQAETYYDHRDSDWYKRAHQERTTIFTDTYQDNFGKGLMISCAAPFFQADSTFAGVVGMDVRLKDLSSSILNSDLGKGSFSFLLNRNGDVIASSDAKNTLAGFTSIKDPAAPTAGIASQLMSGMTTFVAGGNDSYYACAPIPSADWTLVVSVPASLVTAQADQLHETIENSTSETAVKINRQIAAAIFTFFVIFLLTICAVIFLSSRFSRALTLPLTKLQEDASEISSGKLDHVATVSGNDEIGDLAVSFNSMTASLKHYISDLTAVTAEKERIGAELGVARHIQGAMLPCIFPAFPERPEFDIYATMTPAKEVGGDFYDFFLIDDDRLAMVIADVSGKGVPAALFMVIAKTLIKNAAQTGLAPHEILEKVNNQLCESNEAEMFVTVWLGILEISTGHLVSTNAGHEYPALKRAGGSYELVKTKHGRVVAALEGSRYKEHEITLQPGDCLYLYTDGVTEATNAGNKLYGTDRMLAALNAAGTGSADTGSTGSTVDGKELLRSVKQDIDSFVADAPQFDDITMMSLMMRDQENGMQKLKIKPSAGATEEVTAFVETKLNDAGVPRKTINQINIAIDEIFSNIVNYSSATDATVGISTENGIATLRFADNGLHYDPTIQGDPNVSLSAEERKIGGLGVFLVKKLMDSISYEYKDGLNILILTKNYTPVKAASV